MYVFAVLIINKTCIMDIHERRGNKAFITRAREFRDEIQGASELGATWRECNVIAVRSIKKSTSARCVRFWRRDLSAECTRKMHGNVYGDRVGYQHIFRQRDLAATSNNERECWRPKGRCNGNRPGRVGAPCEGSQSQECNGRSAGRFDFHRDFFRSIRDTIVERR